MQGSADRQVTFSPSEEAVRASQLTAFIAFCAHALGLSFESYAAFEAFAVGDFRLFWGSFLAWSGISYDGDPLRVCEGEGVETAEYFPDLRLNFAEQVLARRPGAPETAIISRHFGGGREEMSREQLRVAATKLALKLRALGVEPGDRVAAIARNSWEAVTAALATSAIGAVYSSCSPEMGPFAILSRFGPIEPVVLLAHFADEASDAGTPIGDRAREVAENLSGLRAVITLDDGDASGLAEHLSVVRLADILSEEVDTDGFEWPRLPFSHPLFIMFSSGTTGAPKCIVHGAGGSLLEHLKEHRLHCDIRDGDRLFYQTTCAWMMWNWQLTALASGATLVLFDGPLEGPDTLWRIAAEEEVSLFGTSPAYLQFCERSGFSPAAEFDLSALRGVYSTGSILYPPQYDWFKENVGDKPLQSISGGTDILGCFVLGNPNLPVRRGEAQCRSLGMDVRALGAAQPGDVGELVCANPFPSRPTGFFGDADGSRFHNAYFADNAGVWTHGDLIEMTPHGGAVMHGRSDGVLNINGLRVGPAELYRILQDFDEIAEALAVEQTVDAQAGGSRLILLVKLREGAELDRDLLIKIRTRLVQKGSSAFLPARIADVRALPKTHSGKLSETAARDALNGAEVRNRDALQNPESLDEIVNHPALRETEADVVSSAGADIDAAQTLDEIETALTALCARALALPSVQLTDNLHSVGADSLSAVNIAMEIEQRLGCPVPLTVLFAAPSIKELAAYVFILRDASAESAAQLTPEWAVGSSANVEVRPATRGDIEQIIELLGEGFGPDVSKELWTRIFEYGWSNGEPEFGFVAVDGDAVVGFLATICAQRRIGGREVKVCNLSSWHVRTGYQGIGSALIAAATSDAAATYTALTPAALTQRVLSAMGFEHQHIARRAYPALFQFTTLMKQGRPIITDPDEIRATLNDEHRRIFDDHAGLDCAHLISGDATQYCYVIAKRRRYRRPLPVIHSLAVEMLYSQILYCSDWAMLGEDFERIKLALMKAQSTRLVTADARRFPGRRPFGFPVRDHAQFKSADVTGEQLDEIYSELVLLPI